MNARAGQFSNADSLYTKRRTIFTDVDGGTALAEDESFLLDDLFGDDPVVRFPYEDAPTTRPGDLFILDVPSLGFNPADVHRALAVLQDWTASTFYFVVPPSDASTLTFTRRSEPPILDWSSCLAGFVDEEIEDGMTASLGEKISNLIRFHGSKAIKRLRELISSNELSPSLASHTLRWLGRIKDPASFDSRLELLCESLQSKSPIIRDGASLGLAALGSPKAISFLQDAIDQEKLPGLRTDMEQVLRELQN
jgi:hypothetical protein